MNFWFYALWGELALMSLVLFALMGGIFALLIRYAGPILLFVLLYSLIRRM